MTTRFNVSEDARTDARVMELAMEKYRSRYGTTKIYHPENYCQGFKNGYEAAVAEMKSKLDFYEEVWGQDKSPEAGEQG